jgi:two-component system LytT family response regulator
MISAIIIDDENESIDITISLINHYHGQVDFVGRGNTVGEGVELIRSKKPDLVFLDIQLGDELGFAILDQVEIDFQIIFISGYKNFAINAFKYSAIDFLLKPVEVPQLIDAIQKAEEKMHSPQFSYNQLKILIDNIKAPRPYMLSVPTSDGAEIVNIDDIVDIKAEGSYSVLFLQDNSTMLVCKNIGEFQEHLPEEEFCRVHNSFIINLKYIKKIRRKGGFSAELLKGKTIPISRNRKDDFMNKIDNYLINRSS